MASLDQSEFISGATKSGAVGKGEGDGMSSRDGAPKLHGFGG
jgi:hypothetical protein